MVNGIFGAGSASNAASTRKGISGLISGMDTDQLVKDLTSSTRAKITKYQQQQQLLKWQRSKYQSITTDLLNFQSKYMSAGSKNSMLSSAFFENATVTSLGTNAGAVSVTGTGNQVRDFTVKNVDQLATIAGFTTEGSHSIASQQIATGEINLLGDRAVSTLEGQTLDLSFGGGRYTLTLTDVKSGGTQAEQATNLESAFNAAIKRAGLEGKVQAKLVNGAMTLQNLDSGAGKGPIGIVGGGKPLLDTLGFTTGTTVDPGASIVGTVDIAAEAIAEVPPTTPDGTDGKPAVPAAKLQETVTFAKSLAKGDGKLTFDLDGTKAVINLSKLLNADGKFVNGKGEVADATGTFADGTKVDMNYLKNHVNSELKKTLGDKVSVEVAGGNGGATIGSLVFKAKEDNSILSVAQGSNGVSGTKGAMNLEVGTANRLLLYEPLNSSKSNLSTKLDFTGGKTYSMKVNDTTFEVGEFSIKVNGKERNYKEGVAANDILSAVNESDAGVKIKYMSTSDRFSVAATASGTVGKAAIGGVAGVDPAQDLSTILFGAATGPGGTRAGETIGQDAKLTVSFDGRTDVTLTRSSNAFNLDGMNVTLNSTFAAGSGAVTFSAKANTEEMVKNITAMVADYNSLIEKVNKELGTKKDREYTPLTADQRKDMSEEEIKSWEGKAQDGLLFGDNILSSLARELRFNFGTPVDGLMMRDIGITTAPAGKANAWKENGKLYIDENKLRAALEEKPDKVVKLFTAEVDPKTGQGGAMAKANAIVDKYAATKIVGKGLLVEKAGFAGSPLAESSSQIFKQLDDMDKIIKEWERKLKSEEDRHYKKFSSMEVYLNKMNAQAGWMSEQLGG